MASTDLAPRFQMRSPKAGEHGSTLFYWCPLLTTRNELGRAWESFGPDPWLNGEGAYETIIGVQSTGVVRFFLRPV